MKGHRAPNRPETGKWSSGGGDLGIDFPHFKGAARQAAASRLFGRGAARYDGRVDDKERFEGCVKLAELVAGRLDFRRQVEWRLSIALWSVLVAAIAWFRVVELPVWIGASIVAAHANWLQSLFVRHVQDTKIIWHFFHEAQGLLAESGTARAPNRPELRIGAEAESSAAFGARIRRRIGFLAEWGMRFQFFLTALLTVMVYLVCADEITWLVLTPKAAMPGA